MDKPCPHAGRLKSALQYNERDKITRSICIAPFPKAALASLEADSKAAANLRQLFNLADSLPPPPAESLKQQGSNFSATSKASSAVKTSPSDDPGITGTLCNHLSTSINLIAIISMRDCPRGPMNFTPTCYMVANFIFLKNPKPG